MAAREPSALTARGWGTSAQRASPPSRFRLFNAILAIRWVALCVASAGYVLNLTTRQADYRHFIPAIAVAFFYTLALSMFARRAYEWRVRSLLFLVMDYSVTLFLFSMTGSVWNPFLAFGSCSFALAGLAGTKRAGLAAGIGLVFTYALSLALKGYTWSSLQAADGLGLAFVYSLEFVVFSIAWAFSVGVLIKLDAAYADLESTRDRLARANATLDERRERLLALDRIRHAILLDLDAEEIVRIVVRALEELDYPRCRMWLLDNDALRPFPEEDGVAAIDVHGAHPIAVAAHDREVVVTRSDRVEDGSEDELPPPCVAVPVMLDDDLLGVVAVDNSGDEGLSEDRIEVLELFAGQVALALQHVKLFEQSRDYAVARERNRVATEMHETVVLKLYDASVMMDSLNSEDVPPESGRRIRLLKDTILASLQDLRFAVLNWLSLEWENTPRTMVERYLREFTGLSGIRVRLEGAGTERGLPASKAQDLLRILQETLSNVWRHGQATGATVRLDFEVDGLRLTVADDGVGFDPAAAARGSGIGLRSVEERASRHGGTMELITAPGEGTRLRVWMPWP